MDAATLALGIIGDVMGVVSKLNAGAISEEEGQRLLGSMGRLKVADTDLDATIADSDKRHLDAAAALPVTPAQPTPPIVAPAASSATTPQPTGEG